MRELRCASRRSVPAPSLYSPAPFSAESLHARAVHTLGRADTWLDPFLDRFLATFPTRPRLRAALVFQWADPAVPNRLPVANWLPPRPQTLSRWSVPDLPTPADLADFLGITPRELAWFSSLRRPSHYHVQLIPKRSGGTRQLAVPKPRLKGIQGQLLAEVLSSTVALRSAAHGFCPARSIHTFVAPHVRSPAVLRFDLANFFPSLRFPRIAAFFRTAGYPDALAAPCTHDGPCPCPRFPPSPTSSLTDSTAVSKDSPASPA